MRFELSFNLCSAHYTEESEDLEREIPRELHLKTI